MVMSPLAKSRNPGYAPRTASRAPVAHPENARTGRRLRHELGVRTASLARHLFRRRERLGGTADTGSRERLAARLPARPPSGDSGAKIVRTVLLTLCHRSSAAYSLRALPEWAPALV